VTARDELTLEFVLQEPSTAFTSIMGFPLYIWTLNEVGYAKAHENDADYARNIVGAGPYMLKEWVPGKSVMKVKNPHYWRPEEQREDELVFVVVTGPERANNWATLRAGDVDIDWTSGDLAAWGRTQTEFNFNVGFRSSSGLVLNFNARKPPFDDPRVRRAMVQAIDRKAVVQIVYQGGQTVADQAFAPAPNGIATD